MTIPSEYVKVLTDAGYDPVEVELMLAPIAHLGLDAPIADINALQPNMRHSDDARRAAVNAARVDWWSAEAVDDTYRRVLDASVENADAEVVQETDWRGSPVFKAWMALVAHLDDSPSARVAWERQWQDSASALLDEHDTLTTVPLTFPYESYTAQATYTDLKALGLHDNAAGVQLASYLFGLAEGVVKAAQYDESKHPRYPKGHPKAGKWMPKGSGVLKPKPRLRPKRTEDSESDSRVEHREDGTTVNVPDDLRSKRGKGYTIKSTRILRTGYGAFDVVEREFRYKRYDGTWAEPLRYKVAEYKAQEDNSWNKSKQFNIAGLKVRLPDETLQRSSPRSYEDARARVDAVMDQLKAAQDQLKFTPIEDYNIPQVDGGITHSGTITFNEFDSRLRFALVPEDDDQAVEFENQFGKPMAAFIRANWGEGEFGSFAAILPKVTVPRPWHDNDVKAGVTTEVVSIKPDDALRKPDETPGDYFWRLNQMSGFFYGLNNAESRFRADADHLVLYTVLEANYWNGREKYLAKMPGFEISWRTDGMPQDFTTSDGRHIQEPPYIYAKSDQDIDPGSDGETIDYYRELALKDAFERERREARLHVMEQIKRKFTETSLLLSGRANDLSRVQQNLSFQSYPYPASAPGKPLTEESAIVERYDPVFQRKYEDIERTKVAHSLAFLQGEVASEWKWAGENAVYVPADSINRDAVFSDAPYQAFVRKGITVIIDDDRNRDVRTADDGTETVLFGAHRAGASSYWAERERESFHRLSAPFTRNLKDDAELPTPIRESLESPYEYHGAMWMSLDTSHGTWIHEYGHMLEGLHPNLAVAATDFLERRTASDQVQRLRDIYNTDAYRKGEITRKDRFASAYTGKIYKDTDGRVTATEVTSMGLQSLLEGPFSFRANDPEFYEYSIRVMLGDPVVLGGDPAVFFDETLKRDNL